MIRALSAAAMFAITIAGAAVQNAQAAGPELLGIWNCSTSFDLQVEGEKAVTRVLRNPVFAPDGTRSEAGTIQWFNASGSVYANFSSTSEFTSVENTIIIDLATLNVGEPTVRQRAATTRDPLAEFADGVEGFIEYASNRVFEIVELNNERLATVAEANGTRSLCIRKG